MKLENWACYSWNLKDFATGCPPVAPSFSIRPATPEDEEAVRAVVLSSFTLDSAWSPFLREIRPLVETALASIFHEKHVPHCLVVAHGARVIGASGMTLEPEAKNHLLTGPCLSMEYHNRGLATTLLAQSLLLLRDAGLSAARGITRKGSVSAQFIYTKFGSVRLPDEPLPLTNLVQNE